MKVIPLILILASSQFCFAGGETNILAQSEWSEPVTSVQGQTLRARLMITQGHSPAHAGPWPETMVYLELQNVTGSAGLPMQIYFDPGRGLRCKLLDAKGNAPPVVGGGGSGGGAGPCWITLPYDASVRLRANMYGYGKQVGAGLLIQMSPPTMQRWNLRAGDTNVYFMTGIFTATLPTNHVAKNFAEKRSIWNGTLELPKMRVSVPRA
jgi:hypothetical protein